MRVHRLPGRAREQGGEMSREKDTEPQAGMLGEETPATRDLPVIPHPSSLIAHPSSLGEECGVSGASMPGGDAAPAVLMALHALQHRGQESAGIAWRPHGD